VKPVSLPIVAVDIGNSRIKFGIFEAVGGTGLPEPLDVFEQAAIADFTQLPALLQQAAAGPYTWWMCSVNRPAAIRLDQWLEATKKHATLRRLTHDLLPLAVEVQHPEHVGMDRLAGAVGANRIRESSRAAIVIDLGSAITVDLVSAAGVFLGGAILPGIGMSARALHEFTDQLPEIAMHELDEPPLALGKNTADAMRSGLYWGAVGAIRELITRLGADLDVRPQVFLTGGAAPAVAHLLGPDVQHVPHLVLGGIAVAAATNP